MTSMRLLPRDTDNEPVAVHQPTLRFPAGWYPLVESHRLNRKPLGLPRFGIRLVVWRDADGKPSVLEDLCPHRSARLSAGKVSNGAIVCPFHGLAFNGAGGCIDVPGAGAPVGAFNVPAATTLERDGLVWMHYPIGSSPSQPEPGHAACGDEHAALRSDVLKTHVTRAIENQIDHAHLPHVHATTIGRGASTSTQIKLSLDAAGLDARFEPFDQSDGPGFRFVFPSTFHLLIARDLASLVHFCPIDAGSTAIFVESRQSMVKLPLLGRVAARLLLVSGKQIFEEDRAIVEGHPSGDSVATGVGERLMQSDRAVAAFRKMWAVALQGEPQAAGGG
jgi:phenylpropionate dioxygenase-like ring-hydroxylating dioxygenase large terminal subunit